MPTQPFAGILGVLAILFILWGHFRALGQINKNLNDLKDILRTKDSK